MRLLVLSDLHLEFGQAYAPPAGLDFDAVLLAGDIGNPGTRAVAWAQSTFAGKPVLYVPGNHEFYGCTLSAELQAMRDRAQGSNVRLLEGEAVALEGVRFLGCILWTDFLLSLREPDGTMATDVARSLAEANARLNDFRFIDVEQVDRPSAARPRQRTNLRRLRAEDTLAMHSVARDWLRRELAKPFDGPTVVITHHAPCIQSVATRYESDWLTPAFVSDLPAEFFRGTALWVHGHTHSPFDYRQDGCRVVSNPRGYMTHRGSFENYVFDAGLVVEVPGAEPQALRWGSQHQDSR